MQNYLRIKTYDKRISEDGDDFFKELKFFILLNGKNKKLLNSLRYAFKEYYKNNQKTNSGNRIKGLANGISIQLKRSVLQFWEDKTN